MYVRVCAHRRTKNAQKIAKKVPEVVLQDKPTGATIKKAEELPKEILEAYKVTHGENVAKKYTDEAFNEACKAYAGIREPHAVTKTAEEEIIKDGAHIFG